MTKNLTIPQAGFGTARGPVRSMLLAAALVILCSGVANALPLVWRADWPDCKPVEKYVHRGTDVELQPTWYINGELATTSNWTFSVYVKTNNQATGEWFGPIAGTTFSHTNDVGAAMYQVMLRAQMPGGGVNYTAFARLRMLDSPGFTPGELPLPVSTIDFAQVVAVNAPWLLPDATNATLQAASSYTDGATNALLSSACSYADKVSTLIDNVLGSWTCDPEQIEVNETIWHSPYGLSWWGDEEQGYTEGWYCADMAAGSGPYWLSSDINATNLEWGVDGNTIVATRSPLPGYILGTQSNKVVAAQTSLTALGNTLATNYYTISETDDAIDALAAYYITATAQGAAFATYAALTNTTVYYSGGVARTPTRNDYCVVLADETHGGAEWRYIYAVADGATTGQWDAQYPIETNDYEALSNKPLINGNELFGNKTAAQLGLATPADATLNKRGPNKDGFSAWTVYRDGVDVTAQVDQPSYDDGAEGWLIELVSGDDIGAPYASGDSDATALSWTAEDSGHNAVSYTATRTALSGYQLGSQSSKPLASEAEAEDLRTAVAAAALAATNYTDSATNALPAWTKSATQPLPPDYANVSNKAYSALQSEVDPIWTAEKASYATVSQLRYSFNTATVPAGATPTVTGLVDRAINAVTLGSSVTVATNVLPAATADRARDFFIDMTIQSSDAPTIVFFDPARGTSAAVKYGADSLADIAPGNNLVLFTEIAPTNFLVSVKHEDAQ